MEKPPGAKPGQRSRELAVSKLADALRDCKSQAGAAEASLWAGWPMRCEAAAAEHEQPRARSEQGGRCAARLQKPSWGSRELAAS